MLIKELIEEHYKQSFGEIRHITALILGFTGFFPTLLSLSYLFENTNYLQKVVVLTISAVTCIFAIRFFQNLVWSGISIEIYQRKYELSIVQPEIVSNDESKTLNKLLPLLDSYMGWLF